MKLYTISEVTKAFNVTTRMLRYYDKIGLLPSCRTEGYAYRMYDEEAVKRLQQIITLRKLRIPLKKIALIFGDYRQKNIVEVFQESVSELNDEITALQTIRDILSLFIARLNEAANTKANVELLDDAELIGVIQTLSLSKINFKEERCMDDLNKANEALSPLKNVRILYLPPATVAASNYFGKNPEDIAQKQMNDFIVGAGLHSIKPDFRVYGFNNPSPQTDEAYGYEYWVTIPENLEVPEPLKKKHFTGGLYAAHCIKMGDFHEWPLLGKWVDCSREYDYDAREPLSMGGCLEEHLNPYSYFANSDQNLQNIQLDLLSPIKKKY